MANGVCLCQGHHTKVHEGGYTIQHVDGHEQRLNEQFEQQQQADDLSLFDFEKELRNDRDSFSQVRSLLPTRYRFRIVDADGNDIRHRSSATRFKDEVQASSTAVESTATHSTATHSTATHSTAVHPTAAHSTAVHSTRVECGGSLSGRCGDAGCGGDGGIGSGGEDDQASQVAELPAVYQYGVCRDGAFQYGACQYGQGTCERQVAAR